MDMAMLLGMELLVTVDILDMDIMDMLDITMESVKLILMPSLMLTPLHRSTMVYLYTMPMLLDTLTM